MNTNINYTPEEHHQRLIVNRYFSGFSEGSDLAGFICAITEATGVEFTSEQIKELIIAKISKDMNIELGYISASEPCHCHNDEDGEDLEL